MKRHQITLLIMAGLQLSLSPVDALSIRSSKYGWNLLSTGHGADKTNFCRTSVKLESKGEPELRTMKKRSSRRIAPLSSSIPYDSYASSFSSSLIYEKGYELSTIPEIDLTAWIDVPASQEQSYGSDLTLQSLQSILSVSLLITGNTVGAGTIILPQVAAGPGMGVSLVVMLGKKFNRAKSCILFSK